MHCVPSTLPHRHNILFNQTIEIDNYYVQQRRHENWKGPCKVGIPYFVIKSFLKCLKWYNFCTYKRQVQAYYSEIQMGWGGSKNFLWGALHKKIGKNDIWGRRLHQKLIIFLMFLSTFLKKWEKILTKLEITRLGCCAGSKPSIFVHQAGIELFRKISTEFWK